MKYRNIIRNFGAVGHRMIRHYDEVIALSEITPETLQELDSKWESEDDGYNWNPSIYFSQDCRGHRVETVTIVGRCGYGSKASIQINIRTEKVDFSLCTSGGHWVESISPIKIGSEVERSAITVDQEPSERFWVATGYDERLEELMAE